MNKNGDRHRTAAIRIRILRSEAKDASLDLGPDCHAALLRSESCEVNPDTGFLGHLRERQYPAGGTAVERLSVKFDKDRSPARGRAQRSPLIAHSARRHAHELRARTHSASKSHRVRGATRKER